MLVKTRTIENPNAFRSVGVENGWTLSDFKENFSINITRKSEDGNEIEFDMVGIDPPLANAFRRILIAEVPTMAIDQIRIWQNTSVIVDEVLANRIGLIPISADPHAFEYRRTGPDTHSKMTPQNIAVFTLSVKCERVPDVPEDAPESQKYTNSRGAAGLSEFSAFWLFFASVFEGFEVDSSRRPGRAVCRRFDSACA